jgi:hypothetical protein
MTHELREKMNGQPAIMRGRAMTHELREKMNGQPAIMRGRAMTHELRWRDKQTTVSLHQWSMYMQTFTC